MKPIFFKANLSTARNSLSLWERGTACGGESFEETEGSLAVERASPYCATLNPPILHAPQALKLVGALSSTLPFSEGKQVRGIFKGERMSE